VPDASLFESAEQKFADPHSPAGPLDIFFTFVFIQTLQPKCA